MSIAASRFQANILKIERSAYDFIQISIDSNALIRSCMMSSLVMSKAIL